MLRCPGPRPGHAAAAGQLCRAQYCRDQGCPLHSAGGGRQRAGRGAIRGDTSIRTLMHRIVLEEGKKNSGFLTAIVAAGSYCAATPGPGGQVTVRCCATVEAAAPCPDPALGWL